MKKRVVLKIGTSTLTAGSGRISFGKIEDIARQIETLRESYDVVVVSSGAIAAAKQVVGLNSFNGDMGSKQALAAIGQPRLMRFYDEIFERYGMFVSQCLLTYSDFSNPVSENNTRNTIIKLLEHGVVPIINENDTVAVEEIMLGDNDRLSALVASIINADLLVIASDIDGLYDSDPRTNPNASLIEVVNDIEKARSFAGGAGSSAGTGGMLTKLHAAEMCRDNGIEMWIVNGGESNFLTEAMSGTIKFTKFKTETL